MSVQSILERPDYAPGYEVLEQLAENRGWFLEQRENGDMVLDCEGQWGSYDIHFSWNKEYRSLHITCCLDLNIPDDVSQTMNELLAEMNAKLWIGHFAMAPNQRTPAYRHTLLMIGGESVKSLEVEDIIETALGECDRFYPAFQFVACGGKSAEEAMQSALLECIGNA